MRIIIRFCSKWGNMSTKPIMISLEWSVKQLKKNIEELVEIKEENQLLILNEVIKLFLYKTIMDDEDSLSDYKFEKDQFLYVDTRGDIQNESLINQENNPIQTKRFFQKLGIVREEDEQEGESMKSKTMAEYLEDFIMAVRNDDWQQAEQILKEQSSSNMQTKTSADSEFINDRSQKGWNALHYASYQGLEESMRGLLLKNADVNLQTKDGWTPLQLAVRKNRIQCVKMLLNQSRIQPNYERDGVTALDLALECDSQELVDLLIQHQNFDKTILKHPKYKSHPLLSQNGQQKKPSLMKGYVKKVNIMKFFHYKRFLVLDPDSGFLTRYETEADYPFRSKELIALENINSVEYVQKHSWYMKSDHFYLMITYSKVHKILICSKSKKTMDLWKQSLEESIIYYKEQDQDLKRMQEQRPDFVGNAILTILEDQRDFQFIRDSRIPTQNEIDQIEKLALQSQQPKNKIKKPKSPNESPLQKQKIPPMIDIKPLSQTYLDKYQTIKMIGKGNFGRVFLVRHKQSEKLYAMKQLNKDKLIQKRQIKFAVQECQILKQVNFPYIINLVESFQTPNYLYLVMEYAKGGDLAYHLYKYQKFPEKMVKIIIKQLILAIEYIHSLKIIYRDLKSENIAIGDNGILKLIDFGLSKQTENLARSFCGTPAYLTPEVLDHRGANQSTDVYGIGTVMYELLTGNPPYYDEDQDTLYENIRNGNLIMPNDISKQCQQILYGLLQKEQTKRLGCRNPEKVSWNLIKSIEWFGGFDTIEKIPLSDSQESDLLLISHNNKLTDQDYTEENYRVKRILNWSFSRL